MQIVGHGDTSASLQLYAVASVIAQEAVNLHRRVDVYIHLNVQMLIRSLLRFNTQGVCEVAEGYQVGKLVFDGKGRILQYIRDIRVAQNIQCASHLQVVQRSPDAIVNVNIYLTVCQGVTCLGRIYQLVILGSDIQVQLHILQVAEVDVSVQRQRVVAGCVSLYLRQVYMTMINIQRIVGDAQVDVVCLGRNIQRVCGNAARKDGIAGTALYLEVS